jgi:hypothetical protein
VIIILTVFERWFWLREKMEPESRSAESEDLPPP